MFSVRAVGVCTIVFFSNPYFCDRPRVQKITVPAAITLSAKTVLSVRLQGLEPWTP